MASCYKALVVTKLSSEERFQARAISGSEGAGWFPVQKPLDVPSFVGRDGLRGIRVKSSCVQAWTGETLLFQGQTPPWLLLMFRTHLERRSGQLWRSP